jgi:transcriptional regulator with XRE-family HTH domain
MVTRTGKRGQRPPPRRELYERVGVRIRELRMKKGLSQAQLGAPYFTRAMVSAVELGKVAPSLVALAHFAAKMKVSLRELLPAD